MVFRPLRILKNALAAIVLLIGIACGAEIYLRKQQPPATEWVCGQTSCAMQSLLVPSDLVHHQLVPDSRKTVLTRGQNIDVRINQLGLRGQEVVIPRPAETFRILVLGDDVVFGTGVTEDDCLTTRLQSLLNRQSSVSIEVINGGVPGYCPLLSWLQYEHLLTAVRPDLVILHFDITDVADDSRYRSLLNTASSDLPAHVPKCQHSTVVIPLSDKPPAGLAVFRSLQKTALGSLLFKTSRDYLQTSSALTLSLPLNTSSIAWALDSPPDLRIQVRHAMEPLLKLQSALDATKTPLLVSCSPCIWQVVADSDSLPCSAGCRIQGATPLQSRLPFEVLSKFCQQHQIRFVDTSEAFTQFSEKERLFNANDGLLTRYGVALYARELAAYLIQFPPRTWNP